jgi:RecB family exonuclease
VHAFFAWLEKAALLECPSQKQEMQKDEGSITCEDIQHFETLFSDRTLRRREWLFLWMKRLSKLTIDDVRGGKITVMGVLETRGVEFDGVVIVDFNEGVVPAASAKDQFLDSAVRHFAGLPAREDRESLQKHYYWRLLEQAKHSVILYCGSDNRLPSRFLYELGLKEGEAITPPRKLFYPKTPPLPATTDPVVEYFDARTITWSASRLKTWLSCKRKYYYRYLRQIPQKQEQEIDEGAFLHRLLHRIFEKEDHYETVESMQKAIDVAMASLLSDPDAATRYRMELWRKKLEGFVRAQIAHFAEGWRVAEREYEILGEIGGLRFTGRIDRIDRQGDETLVIDYKSGSIEEANRKKNFENLSDFQMSIYDRLLAPRFTKRTMAFVQLFEEGRTSEITALEEKTSLLEEHIEALMKTDTFVAERCEDLRRCHYCEFALVCERGEYFSQ